MVANIEKVQSTLRVLANEAEQYELFGSTDISALKDSFQKFQDESKELFRSLFEKFGLDAISPPSKKLLSRKDSSQLELDFANSTQAIPVNHPSLSESSSRKREREVSNRHQQECRQLSASTKESIRDLILGQCEMCTTELPALPEGAVLLRDSFYEISMIQTATTSITATCIREFDFENEEGDIEFDSDCTDLNVEATFENDHGASCSVQEATRMLIGTQVYQIEKEIFSNELCLDFTPIDRCPSPLSNPD